MWKEHDVVMLSTNKASSLVLNLQGQLEYDEQLSTYGGVTQQHLYITDNSEIKEGDWCYDKVLNVIYLVDNTTNLKYVNQTDNEQKIIATTDTSLRRNDLKPLGIWIRLSAIPQSFINYFITEYNKGNVISKVMVEYDEYSIPNGNLGETQQVLKLNPDNTINIEYKDSWKRREVSNLIFKFKDSIAMELGISADEGVFEFRKLMKWINENL